MTAAMCVFWEKGLSATSLDDLALAMNMTRPSIYNAFGNKEEIYRTALAQFCSGLDLGLEVIADSSVQLRPAFMAFFDQAIEVYCGNNPSMGCLMICTAPSEVLTHPEIGRDLSGLIRRLDAGFVKRLQLAQEVGELSAHVDSKLSAKLLQATLQTLALRARGGESKTSLRKLARYAVAVLV